MQTKSRKGLCFFVIKHTQLCLHSDVDRLEYEDKRYVVLGLPNGNVAFAESMAAEFGDKFIDLRAYMRQEAMAAEGLELTAEDEERLADDLIPTSLLSDKTHFNAYGYHAVGKVVYEKLIELGYIAE